MCLFNDINLFKAKFCKKCLEGMKGFDRRRLGFREELVYRS